MLATAHVMAQTIGATLAAISFRIAGHSETVGIGMAAALAAIAAVASRARLYHPNGARPPKPAIVADAECATLPSARLQVPSRSPRSPWRRTRALHIRSALRACRQVCEPGGKAGMLERLDHFRQTVPLKRMAMRLPITAIAIRALRQAPSGGIQCNRDGRFYTGDRSFYTCLVDAKADRVAQRHDDGVCFRRIEGGIWLVASHPCG
jgi:hypothetical protein